MVIPYAYIEAARALLGCIAAGAIAGTLIAAVRGERNG